MATAQDIIVDAFFEAGITDQPGQLPGPNFLTDGLGKLNRLVSGMSTRRMFVWTIQADSYVLSPSQTSYTIGPTGDFVAVRPLGPAPGNGIVNANIILVGTNPVVRLPLYIMNDDEWANNRVQQIPTQVPTAIYNDRAYPNSRVYLWGYPTQANELELYTRKQISQFASLGTTFDMPPGYQRAVTKMLAEDVCSSYKKAMVPPSLADEARKARAWVLSLNSVPPNLSNDAANLGSRVKQGYFNWTNGQVV